MPVRVVQSDVLDSSARALVFTVSPDGISSLDGDADTSRLLGNLGRQFQQRWPSAWSTIADQLITGEAEGADRLLSPGGAALVELNETGCPFEIVELVSTLSHTSLSNMAMFAEKGFSRGLRQIFESGERHVAMTPPTGGWRLSLPESFAVVVRSFRDAIQCLPKNQRLEVELELCVYDESAARELEQMLARL